MDLKITYRREQYQHSGLEVLHKVVLMHDNIFCVYIKAIANENLNTIKETDWSFDLVSAFHAAREILAISSKQHTTGINKSKKLSKALHRSIQHVRHIFSTFSTFHVQNDHQSTAFSNTNCLFSWIANETLSADCIILQISQPDATNLHHI